MMKAKGRRVVQWLALHLKTKLALGKGVRVNLSVQVSLNQPSWGWQDGKEIRQIDNFLE